MDPSWHQPTGEIMKTTRRSFIKGLAAVAAALGLSRFFPARRDATITIADLEAGPKRIGTAHDFGDEGKIKFISATMWNSKIIDFRGYTRVLTEAEILAIREDPWGLYKPVEPGWKA